MNGTNGVNHDITPPEYPAGGQSEVLFCEGFSCLEGFDTCPRGKPFTTGKLYSKSCDGRGMTGACGLSGLGWRSRGTRKTSRCWAADCDEPGLPCGRGRR